MSNLPAIEAIDYGGHAVTDDQKHTLFKFETGQMPVVIALPSANLSQLVQSSVAALSQISKRPTLHSGPVGAFKIDWWEVATAVDGSVVVSFRMAETGGSLSFSLSRDMIPGLHETLSSILGAGPSVPTQRNS